MAKQSEHVHGYTLSDQAGRESADGGGPPGSGVILFGSHARGDARSDSDVDFLVVEPVVHDRNAEMVRLRDAVRPLRIPVDVLVTSRHTFERWRDTPNNVLHERTGKGRCSVPWDEQAELFRRKASEDEIALLRLVSDRGCSRRTDRPA